MASVNGIGLASEAITGVRDAQAALQEEADRLAAVGDPLAQSWAALAGAGKASNRLLLDVFLKTEKMLEEGRKPWTQDETQILIAQLDRSLLYRWTQFNRTAIAVAAGLLLVLSLAAGATGYWLHGSLPILVGIHAGAEKCQDRPDGSRLCWIPVWERLPAGRH